LQAIKALTLTVSDQFTAEQYELLFTYLPRIQHLSIYSYSNRAFHGDVHTLLKAAQPLTLHHLVLINLTRYNGDHKDILPNELWQFTTLKTLTIRGFAKLSFIPENIDQLQELTLLDLDFSNLDGVIPHRIRKLPDSLWRLKKLEKLILRNLIRVEIPESIGQLSALKSLTLEDMHLLKMLPSSLWRLNKLESLTLNNLEITALPEEMGQLKALKSLTLSILYIKGLPASLGQLDNLEVITLESLDNITTLPEAMNQLKAIKVVKLINMKKLGTLPGRLAQLVVRR
jgi:Leucine-rich repeat (LRR) protein